MNEKKVAKLHFQLALYYLKKENSDYDDKLIALSNLMIIKDFIPVCYKMVCDTMLELDYISKEKIDDFCECLLEFIKYYNEQELYFDIEYSLLIVFSDVYLNLLKNNIFTKELLKKYLKLDCRLNDFKIDEFIEITKIKNQKKRAQEINTFCNILINKLLNNEDMVKAMNGEIILKNYIKKILFLIGE